MYAWLQSSIWSNRFKTTLLIIAFPIALFAVIYIVFLILWSFDPLQDTIFAFYILWPILIIWLLISFYFHKQILFKFSWAEEITRQSHPQIYNIVEDLCISRGLPTPNIWIIKDKWMNAFAVGWKPEKSWIVFTSWLLDNLNKQEIQAVAAHELSHIINKDNLLMTVIIIFIWAISAIWYILLRSMLYSGGGRRDWRAVLVVSALWIALIILWSIVYPLMKFTLSRKREYLADAGAVELTKDNYAMISALQKISKQSHIRSLEEESIANMCIEDPLQKQKMSSLRKTFHNLFSTHPSVEDRVLALKSY